MKIPKGEYFRVLRPGAVVKVTFDPKGADAGSIPVGDIIEVFEQGQNKGVNMMRTSAGWTIKEDEDGVRTRLHGSHRKCDRCSTLTVRLVVVWSRSFLLQDTRG